VSARKHIKLEIGSFCPSLCSRAGEIFTFSQVIDTKASNHCKKIYVLPEIIKNSKIACFRAETNCFLTFVKGFYSHSFHLCIVIILINPKILLPKLTIFFKINLEVFKKNINNNLKSKRL